jgi:glycerate kinase
MHVLIAPNAFKNSLTAGEAADAIKRGLSHSRLSATSECCPVGDGGDGTGDLLIQYLQGRRIPAKVRDPRGRAIDSYFGLIEQSNTAIIEMASASGLRLIDPAERNPLHTSSAGTGDLIRAALDLGAGCIILGMGGSATVDGGTGILQALGVRFTDVSGRPLEHLPVQLSGLASIDLSDLDPRLETTELIVLCDVTNPLTGPRGAAAVFGPQKGADPAAVRLLESGLKRFAEVVFHQTGKDLGMAPRAGAAGGAAAGLHGLLNATLVSGIDYFLEITGFDAALDRSTHVITGEGGIDEQTLQGKAPFGVAVRAKAKGLPVTAMTGHLPADMTALKPYFDELILINRRRTPMAEALANTAANLESAALEWGNRLALEWGIDVNGPAPKA